MHATLSTERGHFLTQPLMVAGFLGKALTLSAVETVLNQSTRAGSLLRARALRARFMAASEILATFCRVNEFNATEHCYQSYGVLRVLNAAASHLTAPVLFKRAMTSAKKDFSLFSEASFRLSQSSHMALGEVGLDLAAAANFSVAPQRTFFTGL